MPLDFCHPQAPHKKLRVPEWYISSLMLDRALDAVVRRVKKLDREHDIPYLAGYSKDGNTIYIDRHMPRTMKFRNREIDTDRFLILHEEVEKTLIDRLNLHYLHAHQIAARAEEAAVRAAGVLWRDYDRFMQKHVKHIGDERLTKVPADLDLKPYRDEHDLELLQRICAADPQGQGAQAPLGALIMRGSCSQSYGDFANSRSVRFGDGFASCGAVLKNEADGVLGHRQGVALIAAVGHDLGKRGDAHGKATLFLRFKHDSEGALLVRCHPAFLEDFHRERELYGCSQNCK